MTTERLEEFRRNIRKNWNEGVNLYTDVKRETTNCYMFAVGCTKPTEICVGEIKGVPATISTIGEMGTTYFGTIGQFSNNTQYFSVEDVEKSMIADMNALGLKCIRCEPEAKVPKHARKIAFYYDIDALKSGEHPQFHFMRFDNQYWYYKLNWLSSYQKVPRKNLSAEAIDFEGLTFVGTYLISLCR